VINEDDEGMAQEVLAPSLYGRGDGMQLTDLSRGTEQFRKNCLLK